MNIGDYVKVAAGANYHAGIYGRIYESRPNMVFVDFAYPSGGFTGAAFSRSQLVLITKKQYFKALLSD